MMPDTTAGPLGGDPDEAAPEPEDRTDEPEPEPDVDGGWVPM